MDDRPLEIADSADALCANRIGFARLAKLAFDGCDLQPLLEATLRKIGEGTASAGETIDLSVVAIKTPVASTPAKIDDRGVLQLRGYFDTQPSRVLYELDFLVSEEEWKPLSINVKVRPASEK